jgi:hypothetical protein
MTEYTGRTRDEYGFDRDYGDAARPDVSDVSVGELIRQVTRDLSTLMRQELDLAKAEVRQEFAKSGQAAGMLGGATLAGYFVLFFLSAALWWALSNVMDQGWAALIVAVIWAIIGAILYTVGRRRLREVRPKPEQTAETLKEIPETLKPNRSQS